MEKPRSPIPADGSDTATPDAMPRLSRSRSVAISFIIFILLGALAFWVIHTVERQFHEGMNHRYGAEYFTRQVELAEDHLKLSPGAEEATREVTYNLERLAEFLAQRRQPGDMDKAFGYFARSLELKEALLKASPASAQATRDVSMSLQKLGEFLATRGQTGDAEKAMSYCARDLELTEALLNAKPGSPLAARHVVDLCGKLANFSKITKTGEPRKWWQRAYDGLAGMKEKGMFLSPEDLQYLETLRGKLNL